MKPVIKICGLTRVEDIELCEELKVEYIGLNFVPTSPRTVPAVETVELRTAIVDCKAVGIFADAKLAHVVQAVNLLQLDAIQLHGSEDLEYARSIPCQVIKAFRYIPDIEELESYIFGGCSILLDGTANGKTANWEEIGKLPTEIKEQLFLAGGLTPENVQEAIDIVGPYTVDTASGVESAPGIKDHDLLKEFINRVRNSE